MQCYREPGDWPRAQRWVDMSRGTFGSSDSFDDTWSSISAAGVGPTRVSQLEPSLFLPR